MAEQAPRLVIAQAFLKTALTHQYNRCDMCGRRLKYKPGAWIGSTGERFTTCRSCGYDNPSLFEKVSESLEADGFNIGGGVLDLPQCLGDGTELQVSRDFTKVFCSTCGREWDRYEFEDIMGGPLSPQLAGAIPLDIDNSKLARTLDQLLIDNGVDAGSPYLVCEVITRGSARDVSFGKGFLAALKDGWDEGRSGKARVDTGDSSRTVTEYLAVYADGVAHYSWDGDSLDIEEISFDDFFSDASAPIAVPFNVRASVKSLDQSIVGLLARFRVMHIANATPYAPELFGTAARDAARRPEAVNAPVTSIADELRKLAELRDEGLLTDEEFATAKARVMERS